MMPELLGKLVNLVLKSSLLLINPSEGTAAGIASALHLSSLRSGTLHFSSFLIIAFY